MRKVILSCLTICAAIAVAEPALAHKRHGSRPHAHIDHYDRHYPRRKSHNHCHTHERRLGYYTHCHRHTHDGPGRGHHGRKWMHSPFYPDHYFHIY